MILNGPIIVAATSFLVVSVLLCCQPDARKNFRAGSLTNSTNTLAKSQRRQLKSIIVHPGNPPVKYLPLEECSGDCDPGKSQCAAGLVCFARDPGQAVPGCSGGEGDKSKTDYCVRKEFVDGSVPTPPAPSPVAPTPPAPTPPTLSGSKLLKRVGNNGKPSDRFPLGLCEGDCDSDKDCQGKLVCFQRNKLESVRGCLGGTSDKSPTDYCVPSDDNLPSPTPPSPTSTPPSSGLFRLKLYWQPGYFWQEETRERKWCAMYKYDGLPGNGKCWYGRERKSCRDDQVYIAKCNKDVRQKFQFVQLSRLEVQIKVGNGENLCFERDSRKIFLRPCDSGNGKQRWFAPSGSFDGPRFELSQYGYSSQCVTQDHHPKAGEVVELHSCKAARSKNHETSYWNKDY